MLWTDICSDGGFRVLVPHRPGHRTLDVVSVSHTIAQIATEMSTSGTPLDIVFGWSLGSALWLATEFLLFGQGDVPNSVFTLLQKAVPNPALRPTVLVG
jgi:hypothetical protein